MEIIWTIEELYQWAKEKGIENFTVCVNDEADVLKIFTLMKL